MAADTGLQLPDFRAAERTFQLIVQVAGRSGRGVEPGKVILQTFHPEHYAIQTAMTQDFQKFAHQEMYLRKELDYPPFGKLLRVIIEGKDEAKVQEKIDEIAAKIPIKNVEILGPAPAPIPRIKDMYRWHIIIKSPQLAWINKCVNILRPLAKSNSVLKVKLDKDPYSLL